MTSRLTDSLHHKGSARIVAKVNCKAQDKTYRWHLFRSCIYRIDIGNVHFRLRTTALGQAILTTLGILMIFNVNTSRWSVTSGPRLHATSNILQGEVCVEDGRRVRERTGYDRLVVTTGIQTLETPDSRLQMTLPILLAMPILDTTRVRGRQSRPLMRFAFWAFVPITRWMHSSMVRRTPVPPSDSHLAHVVVHAIYEVRA
jgi:hypothetical protein